MLLIIAHRLEIAREMESLSEEKFKESQEIRKESLIAARDAGYQYLSIKRDLDDASKNNPIETDLGTFTSFRNFLESQNLSVTSVYRYIKLADNWHVVESMRLMETKACYRLIATLKIIDWFNKSVEEGEDPETLTYQRYWEELGEAASERKQKTQTLTERYQSLQEEYSELQTAYNKEKEKNKMLELENFSLRGTLKRYSLLDKAFVKN